MSTRAWVARELIVERRGADSSDKAQAITRDLVSLYGQRVLPKARLMRPLFAPLDPYRPF